MGDEIAVRRYKLVEGDGSLDVTVRIFKPEPEPDEPSFKCRFQIEWPSGTKKHGAVGMDAIQSIMLALQMLGARIYCSKEVKDGKLVWLEPGAGFGLPVPDTIADLLQGDDRTTYRPAPSD